MTHCRRQLVQLQEHLKEFESRGADVEAISVDSADESRKLAARLHVTFSLRSDSTRTIIRAFGVDDAENEIAWPAVFIIGPRGRVLWRWLAETYKVRPTATGLLAELDALRPKVP